MSNDMLLQRVALLVEKNVEHDDRTASGETTAQNNNWMLIAEWAFEPRRLYSDHAATGSINLLGGQFAEFSPCTSGTLQMPYRSDDSIFKRTT
jgi:hypothetical protein